MLLRLGAALDFDVRTLSEDEGARLVADLHAALTDPASGVADGIGTDEIRELVAGFPSMARAIVSLHRRATDAAPPRGGDGRRARGRASRRARRCR